MLITGQALLRKDIALSNWNLKGSSVLTLVAFFLSFIIFSQHQLKISHQTRNKLRFDSLRETGEFPEKDELKRARML